MTAPKVGKNINITEIHDNTSQELISITVDKLKLILIQYLACIKQNDSWQMPLSLIVTIVLVFCSAEFKPAFGLSADTWCAIFVISGFGCAVWFFVTLFRLKKSMSVDDVIGVIKNKME
jgi:hypothetical protein